ncbi:MAG: hypothetical protein AAFV33_17510, partial [Chloroflexota bacterium]
MKPIHLFVVIAINIVLTYEVGLAQSRSVQMLYSFDYSDTDDGFDLAASAWSATGTYLALATNTRVYLLEAQTGNRVRDHEIEAQQIMWNPENEQYIITTMPDENGNLEILSWNVDTGEQVYTISATGFVLSNYSNSFFLVDDAREDRVEIYSVRDGQSVSTLEIEQDQLFATWLTDEIVRVATETDSQFYQYDSGFLIGSASRPVADWELVSEITPGISFPIAGQRSDSTDQFVTVNVRNVLEDTYTATIEVQGFVNNVELLPQHNLLVAAYVDPNGYSHIAMWDMKQNRLLSDDIITEVPYVINGLYPDITAEHIAFRYDLRTYNEEFETDVDLPNGGFGILTLNDNSYVEILNIPVSDISWHPD